MTHDIEALHIWIVIMDVIAAACTTALPLMYSFFPWRSRPIGRLFMLQAISFALAIDLNVLFLVWEPKYELVEFWIDVIVFTAIIISTSALAILMWSMRYPPSDIKGENKNAV